MGASNVMFLVFLIGINKYGILCSQINKIKYIALLCKYKYII